MFAGLARRIFGTANDRTIKKLRAIVESINALESRYTTMSDDELRALTPYYRDLLNQGHTLDDLLPQAFATVREAAKRVLGQRHYDVQLMGGIVLHQGKIAEMRTGEGKTLVATAPVYLNALSGQGVHVVTVNDYLAQRDAAWMGQIYKFLGLSVGCIIHGLTDTERRAAYHADITYATNNELGFDYLRDNMKFSLDEMVQRPFNFAIVDEVDSILVDEARTPLIISGPSEEASEFYVLANSLIPQLDDSHYEKDEKQRAVTLTEKGSELIEELLEQKGVLKGGSLYDLQNILLVHHINQALKAHKIFARDVDYIVKDNKVIIIDEFTGRMMEGRRYSDGLHQALEAKENVSIQTENQTLASITFQNYFRAYPKLAGMTGTAMTESQEFREIYKLDVVDMPTNRTPQRIDHDDEVYRTHHEKIDAIVSLIKTCHTKQQPVLVGTVSIEKSEALSQELKKHKLDHQVLNARYHEQEAMIIADAGRSGAITIATNMAGRGTDIQLGGNLEMRLAHAIKDDMTDAEKKKIKTTIEKDIASDKEKALAAGGLYVIGTERHESRRIDNQLRGRSGRQGDPGETKFFLSLEDDLMRIFGSERLDAMLGRLGMQKGEAIMHSWINKALERAQKKVEARNYDIRKHLLKYDNVMNDQRKVIYEQRRELMQSQDIMDAIVAIRQEILATAVARHMPDGTYREQWDADGLHEEILRIFALDLPIATWADEEGIGPRNIEDRLWSAIEKQHGEKDNRYGHDFMRTVERNVLLNQLDHVWKDHLLSLDHLRQGINLRAFAQKDPLNEYKREAFSLFEDMLDRVKESTISILSHVQFNDDSRPDVDHAPRRAIASRGALTDLGDDWDPTFSDDGSVSTYGLSLGDTMPSEDVSSWSGEPPASRNSPCPCGSGLKYKYCHGKL